MEDPISNKQLRQLNYTKLRHSSCHKVWLKGSRIVYQLTEESEQQEVKAADPAEVDRVLAAIAGAKQQGSQPQQLQQSDLGQPQSPRPLRLSKAAIRQQINLNNELQAERDQQAEYGHTQVEQQGQQAEH